MTTTTAQVLYEQYKVLPPRIRQESKKMIVKETPCIDEEDDDDENGDTIRIAVEPLKEGIRELKLVLAGKLKTTSFDDFLAELKHEEEKA